MNRDQSGASGGHYDVLAFFFWSVLWQVHVHCLRLKVSLFLTRAVGMAYHEVFHFWLAAFATRVEVHCQEGANCFLTLCQLSPLLIYEWRAWWVGGWGGMVTHDFDAPHALSKESPIELVLCSRAPSLVAQAERQF